MGILNEEPIYHENVYAIDLGDRVSGGQPSFDDQGQATAGFGNAPSKHLADRTAYLKEKIDDLSDPTDPDKGAAMVGYSLQEQGAVSRDVHSKLQETVSVRDFGAIGDGGSC